MTGIAFCAIAVRAGRPRPPARRIRVVSSRPSSPNLASCMEASRSSIRARLHPRGKYFSPLCDRRLWVNASVASNVAYGGKPPFGWVYPRWRSYFPAQEFSRYHIEDAQRQCHTEFQVAGRAFCLWPRCVVPHSPETSHDGFFGL